MIAVIRTLTHDILFLLVSTKSTNIVFAFVPEFWYFIQLLGSAFIFTRHFLLSSFAVGLINGHTERRFHKGPIMRIASKGPPI